MLFPRDTLRLFLILVATSLLIFFLDRWGKLNWLKNGFSFVNNPVRRLLWQKISQPSAPESDDRLRFLENQIAVLQAENDQLKEKLQSLEKLLGTPLPPDWKFVPAYNLGVQEGIMAIDQGQSSGIEAGDTVLAENILIGRIKKVEPRTSEVELASFRNLRFRATVRDSAAEGIVVFDERLNQLFLTEVLTEYNLQTDNLVITSGKDNLFPPGLAVGRIEEVEKKEADIYQKATVKPMIDPATLDLVFVRI